MSLWYPCVYCTENLKCTKFSDNKVTSYCLLGPCHDETKSNADRIRAMSDEELAEWVIGIMCKTVKPYMEIREKVLRDNEFYEWLKSPVEVDNGT